MNQLNHDCLVGHIPLRLTIGSIDPSAAGMHQEEVFAQNMS